jgi:guanylate kinase
MKKPKIFVISGPGGVGKTTLIKELFDKKSIQDSFIKGVTATTREKRDGEAEGTDYFFVTQEEFGRLQKRKFFLENEKVLDNYYGTPIMFYKLAKAKDKGLILCLDVKGGMHLKKNCKVAKIITIFIEAPNKQELYKRMKKRAESKEMMKKRVELAKKELQYSKDYDYVILNKTVTTTVQKLKEILLTHQ